MATEGEDALAAERQIKQAEDPVAVAKQKAVRDRTIMALFAAGCLNLGAVCSTLTVRPEVLKAILGNDPAKVGALTARWLALGSGLQLLLSPTLGKLSDSIGRKPVLIGTAVATLLLRVAVALNPTNMSVLMAERIIPQAINYYSQWAIANAAFADLCSSTEELATTFSKFMSWVGIGVLVSPLVASSITSVTGDIKHAFWVSLGFNVATIAVTALGVTETLQPADRKSFSFGGTNPLSFLALFRQSVPVTKFASLYATMQFMQGTQLSDINLTFMANDCNFSQAMQSWSVTAYGTMMMASGRFAKPSIAAFGKMGHTTASLAVSFAGMLLWSIPQAWSHFTGIIIQGIGYERLSTVFAAGVRQCTEDGAMGKGEASAAFTNMRGFTAIIIPLLYARVYTAGRRNGVPGAPFLLAAASAIVAEALNRNLGKAAYD